MEIHDHLTTNRDAWNVLAAEFYGPGERAWAQEEPTWGEWGVPESTLNLFPPDLAGKDTIELGCGTGYVSAWLAKRGAKPVGIDQSEAQLASAREFQAKFGIDFPLVMGNAEATPFADESFDFAISEYGAAIWCDPYKWIPEAHRLLRPGGELVFLTNSLLSILTQTGQENVPASDRLHRSLFNLGRLEYPQDSNPCVEFHLPFGDWIRLFRSTGFIVEDFIELQVPPSLAVDRTYVKAEWTQKWPPEQVWKVKKL